MITIPFVVELLEPLLVAMPSGSDQNSAESLNCIPGSVIRNAAAGHYIRQHGVEDAASDPQCRHLFFDETCIVLNSHRVDAEGRRSLPIPLSWHASKHDLAGWNQDQPLLECTDGALAPDKLKDLDSAKVLGNGDTYCVDQPSGIGAFVEAKVDSQFSVHISHPNRREYKAKDNAQVYGYRTLAASQSFAGAVLAPDEAAASAWRELLGEIAGISIGGSRSAGYGRLRITVQANEGWREFDASEPAEDVVVFTLLSDAIVRDAFGQFNNDISVALGLAGKKCLRQFVKTRLVGGFNNKWGLPIPQALAISAGSVFVFDAADVQSGSDVIQWALERGIGERRHDGFGRIAMNWQHTPETTLTKASKPEPRERFPKVSEQSRPHAQQIAASRLRKSLDQKVIDKADKTRLVGRASASSLARVRNAARKGLFAPIGHGFDELNALMKEIDGKVAAKQLEKVRVGSQTLRQWITDQIDMTKNRTLLWQLELANMSTFAIGGVEPGLTPALHEEYSLRLIELVINHKIRAQRRQEDEHGN